MFSSHFKYFLFLYFIRKVTCIYVDSKELNVDRVIDYTDLSLRERKIANVRDTFLKQKQQKDILRTLDRLISSNSLNVDGITHYEVTPTWEKVKSIEDDFKSLISMQYMKYEFLRDAHWRSWREVKDPSGNKDIISYKCQSKVHENCTDCESKGVWVIEEGMPPCPYEIFSLKNANELCVVKYTETNNKLSPCPLVIKYAELTTTCNNPIVTRWRFTRNYRITGRYSSVICEARDFCEITTLYQVYQEYIVFRILNSQHIIFSRVMRNDGKVFACVDNCGDMDLTTFKVTQTKGNLFNLLPSKAKRQNKKMPKKYQKNIYSNYKIYNNIRRTNINNTFMNIYAKGFPKNISSGTNILPSYSHDTAKSYKGKRKNQWVRTDTGYYIKKGMMISATHTYPDIKTNRGEHSTYYDSYEDIKEKFLSFY